MLARHLLIVSRGLTCVGTRGTSARNSRPCRRGCSQDYGRTATGPSARARCQHSSWRYVLAHAVGWQHMIDSHALLGAKSRFFAYVAALARCRVGQSDPGAWKCAL